MNPCQKPKKRGLRGFQNPRGVPKKIQKRPANPHRMGLFAQISKNVLKSWEVKKWDDRERY